MKIAIAQINPVIGAFEHNAQRIRTLAAQARSRACDLVVFSELALCGYPPRDLLEKLEFVQDNLTWLDRLVHTIDGIGVICGYVAPNPAAEGNPLFNAAAIFEDGRILHRVAKRLLPTQDVFDERRYFEPGIECRALAYKGWRIGLAICEDAWNDRDVVPKSLYHLDPLQQMATDGADLFINLSASPYYAGKWELRQQMLSALARKYGLALIYANQVGGNDGILFDGISCAFDSGGQLMARALDFEEDMVLFDTAVQSPPATECHPVAASPSASMLKALSMGVADYLHKCGFSKAVIGLSGGIDSALTACIAVDALGPENVCALFMPSPYTSTENYADTRSLAANLGISLEEVPIEGIFRAFVRELCPDFDPANPGITEQNLQARIRGTILMAHANRHGSLVLSTGNKSEMAVGYCTLYGDMNGGLAVIADVPKTTVYELAREINASREIIPERIVTKPPSAELKPDQTDQDDLPPYASIDRVVRGYIEEGRGPEELVNAGLDESTVRNIIQRIDRSEYKRRQAAPALKVTPKAFGEGRRYPIAQRYSPGSPHRCPW